MDASARVLDSCRFILGPEAQTLERELAALCGARLGVGTGSGTDALLLALKAVGVVPGDEVITSAFSFVASGTTVVMAGATPVFVDVDPGTYNLDPARVERAITPRTRAIVPVHLYGQPAAMDAICDLARVHGLPVVGDAAQAVGAAYGGRPVAAWGDASILSFYPTKNLGGCGDGGMVLTTRDDVAERVRLLRDHGAPRRYTHVELGACSRLDELQAAAGQAQAAPAVERAPSRHRGPLLGRLGRPAPRAAGRAPARVPHLPPVHGAVRQAGRPRVGPGRGRHRDLDPLPEHDPGPARLLAAERGPRVSGGDAGRGGGTLPALLPGADRPRGGRGGGGGEAVRRRGDVR
jgi:hypothetical protein